jgi:hypothetical protein
MVIVAFACVLDVAAADGGGATAGAATAGLVERGDRGPEVRQVQRALGIPADGIFGPLTERAVKRFQRRRGLVVDGVVGPLTRAALGIGPTQARSSQPSSVRVPRILTLIARCESGGNPRAVSPDGRYRGKYQFSRATWRAVGGEGDPARASEAVQDRMALRLYRRAGTSPWPNCP